MLGIFLSFSLLFAQAWAAQDYSLADLAALTKENAHEEFFDHALDIKPSERQASWQDMVLKMGLVFTQSVLNKAEIKAEDFQKTERIYTWQALKKDATFRDRRHSIGLRYLKSCLGTETPCWKEFRAFWEADQKDPDVAIKLAELMLNQKESPIPLWSLLERPLKHSLSEFYCQKEFVMSSLWGKLEIDFIRVNTGGDFGKKIGETIHADCLPSLMKEANRRLIRPFGSNDRELSYTILSSQEKVDPATEDFFFVMYLLGNPGKGELFNLAWNRLKELGKNPIRRDSVLDMIKMKVSHLPDEIMDSSDDLKKKVILTHFKENFPEYLQHYAQQCISYYGGKSVFPKGNPTIHCQDLMEAEFAPSLLGKDRIKAYQDSRKI